MEEMNYYAVTAKCGHVGKSKYIEITFAIKAKSGKDAAKIGRYIPRVKHDNPMAIVKVLKISYDEYKNLLIENKKNPYLNCKNKQEQNLNCPDIFYMIKDLYEEKIDYKEKRKSRIEYLFKKRKILNECSAKYDYLMV